MWICLIIFKIEFWIVRYHCWKRLSIIIVTVVQQSMNKENIKRMKVLDDETIDKDPVDGDLLTRDIVHYVGKKPKGSINQFEPVQQSRQDHSCLDQLERVHECTTC